MMLTLLRICIYVRVQYVHVENYVTLAALKPYSNAAIYVCM